MRRFVLAVGLSMAVVTVAMAAGPGAATAPRWAGLPVMQSPIGRVLSGVVGRLMVLRSDLNVSDKQRAEIRELLLSRRPQIAETAKSIRDKRIALRDAVLSGEADEAQIRAAADELGKAIGDAAVKAAKLRAEIAPVLTDEQRELIQKFFEENDAAVDKFLTRAMDNQ